MNNFKESNPRLKKEFEDLDEAVSELRSAYKKLKNEIRRFEKAALDEYDILSTELDEMGEELEEEEDDGPLELDIVEVSDVEFEIGAGEVYLKSEEYDKERSDIDREDYEEIGEYVKAMERETPGTSYDSIYILKDGWVQCIKDLQMTENTIIKKAYTYPPEEIEKIEYDVASEGETSEYDYFDGRFSN